MDDFVKKRENGSDLLSKVTALNGSSKTLDRTTFTISRLAEFASKDELTRQIGHSPDYWPLVILKELTDNALDACERAGVSPVIVIEIDPYGISVTDNGAGIPPDVVERILDFSSKTSSNAAYVSPTRGQQGNAMQTLLAMDHALTGQPGVVVIISHHVRHRIEFSVDPILQVPRFNHIQKPIARTGTTIKILWNAAAVLDAAATDLYASASDYSWMNPHARIAYSWKRGEHRSDWDEFDDDATNPNWAKWSPTEPTSAHWYDLGFLKTLFAAECAHGARTGVTRTVANFIGSFRGLTSTGKQQTICQALNAGRQSIAEFFMRGDGALSQLLKLMKAHSLPVKSSALGILGETHVRRLIDGAPKAFRYKKLDMTFEGVPYLIEVGFGYRPAATGRYLVAGLNWSISVTGNPFEDLAGESLDEVLAEQRIGRTDPVVFFLHVASPRLSFVDKGKSEVDLPEDVAKGVSDAVRSVTKEWAKQRKAEERDASARLRRDQQLAKLDRPATIKDAAYMVMRDAYMAASDNGTLPANARQIYYAARPDVLRMTGTEVLRDSYFIQTLLVDYMTEHLDECADWEVVFSDRGHFEEPHTGRTVGLGTLAVRKYLQHYAHPRLLDASVSQPEVRTAGPEGRYGGVLFIEKEGFKPLLDRAQIGARYDLAITSTKGMSNTALRELIDGTCAKYKIPMFILHDFDTSGFSIASTVHQSNRRYRFDTTSGVDFEVVDFGLRLEDIERLGLQSEPATVNGSRESVTARLEQNDASENEIRFLLGEDGKANARRVELNAMTSRQFIDLLEAKLDEHGFTKIIPGKEKLKDAYRLFVRGEKAKRIAAEALKNTEHDRIDIPDDLEAQVHAFLDDNPEKSWDYAVEAVMLSARSQG